MKLLLVYFDNSATRMFVQRKNEKGEVKVTLSTAYNFVSRDEELMRVINVDREEDAQKYLDPGHSYYHVIPYQKFKMHSSVYFDERTKCYKAHYYGFVVLDEGGNLRVISPLQISKDKTQAYMVIAPTKFGKIAKLGDIEEELALLKITTPLDSHKIKEQLEAIDPSIKRISKVKVAQSKPPVRGRQEYFEPLIEVGKKAGKVELDGSINFKEVDSIHEVHKGEPVLRRIPKVFAENGFNIYGEKVKGVMDPPKGFLCGDNIVPSSEDENIYVAALDGCLSKNNRTVTIKEMAIIPNDVDYESGNINFSGSVQVKGSVLPGFEVRAGGDIYIEGNVDDAVIIADGDITVRLGIAGKGDSVIKAGGNLQAKYLLNSEVEVEKNIMVEESIINCSVFSNDKIYVTSKHSKIMGGKVIARHRIEVMSVGSNKETQTELMVGRNLEVERRLDAIRKQIAEARAEVEEAVNTLKNSFGNNLFENPKEFISFLPDIKKKKCILLLNELTSKKNLVKEQEEKAKQVEELLVLDEEPEIIVKQRTFSGTVITVRKEVKRIEKEIENARYYEDRNEKIIRFSSASG